MMRLLYRKNWYETNFGMHEGDQYPFSTKSKQFVWNQENRENIIELISNSFSQSPEKGALNDFRNLENIRSSIVVAFRNLVKETKYGILDEDIELLKAIKNLNEQHKIFQNFLMNKLDKCLVYTSKKNQLLTN